MRLKLLFVGGQPKGQSEPFSIKTHSGKNLRGIVSDLMEFYDFEAGYYDLWRNEEEERRAMVLPAERTVLVDNLKENYHLIPLGHYVHEAVQRAGFDVNYYPHPARHAKRLREILEADIAFWTFELIGAKSSREEKS